MECCERKNFSHNTLLKERPEIRSLFFNTIRGIASLVSAAGTVTNVHLPNSTVGSAVRDR